jgi:hypothetical protein
MKQKVGSLKRNKIYQSYLSPRRGKTQINKIKNEKGEITSNNNEIQGIIMESLGITLKTYIQINWKI